MKPFNLCFDRVNRLSLPYESLSEDGRRVLAMAERLSGRQRERHKSIEYVRRTAVDSKREIFLFVRRDAPCYPAGSHDGYAYLTQSYAKSIRVMCLRIWADARVYPEFNHASNLYFPKENSSGEIPEGAEIMWVHHKGGDLTGIVEKNLVPCWVPTALQGMSRDRLRLFRSSVDFALSFSLLHEIGHNDLSHFNGSRDKSVIKGYELEADCFAFKGLLARMPLRKTAELDELIAVFVTGLIACFMVFQIKCVLEQSAILRENSSSGYPSIRERISQLFASFRSWQNSNLENSISDYITFLDTLLTIANFHPVYSYVIGIPWMSYK